MVRYKIQGEIMREQESKNDTYAFMKVATNVIFTLIFSKSGINKFVEKSVVSIVKEYRHKDKGYM